MDGFILGRIDDYFAAIWSQLIGDIVVPFLLHLQPEAHVFATIRRKPWLFMDGAADAFGVVATPNMGRLIEFHHAEQSATQATAFAVIYFTHVIYPLKNRNPI